MSTIEAWGSESEFSEPEDLRMSTPSSVTGEAARETASPAEAHQAMAHLLTFANQLNESTSQLFSNLTRFKGEAAAADAADLAKCKKETERLKKELSAQGHRIKLLEAERKVTQAVLSATEKALAKARRPKFEPAQIGFFDPDLSVDEYGPGDVVYKGGVPFFRTVEPFVEAAAVAARTLPVATIRKGLHLCLIGSARTWYASALSGTQHEQVTTGNGLIKWDSLLRGKWVQ